MTDVTPEGLELIDNCISTAYNSEGWGTAEDFAKMNATLTAVRTMLAERTWQPIETAPREAGKPLLFVTSAFREYSIGVWDGDCFDMQCAPPLTPFTHWTFPPDPPTPEPAP